MENIFVGGRIGIVQATGDLFAVSAGVPFFWKEKEKKRNCVP